MTTKSIAAFAVFFLSMPLIFSGHHAFAYSGKATYVQGDVSLKSKGQDSKVSQNTNISGGDTLVTGPKSLVILLMEDGAQLKLNEKSTLSVPARTQSSVTLTSGSVFSKIPKQKANRQFKVSTPTAVMGVRGTQFFTSYGMDKEREKDLWMCVNEGSVEVTSKASKKKVLVLAGQGISMAGGSEVTAPKEYEWTKDLNWNLEPDKGALENNIEIKYQKELLKEDYN